MDHHKNVTMKTEFSATPDQLEWIVGYLPSPTPRENESIPPDVIALICDDCGARWDGHRRAWSKEHCHSVLDLEVGKHTANGISFEVLTP